MFLRDIYLEADSRLFSLNGKQDFTVGILLVKYIIFTCYMFGVHTLEYRHWG